MAPFAARSSAEEPNTVTYHSRVAGPAHSIKFLPPNVVAADGELTLFADYNDVQGNSVRLYLVNRTQSRIGFSSQDGDIYVMLEAASEDGEWERAQTHQSSWCGNSYMVTPSLRPGEYFSLFGDFPSQGEERKVRFRMYRDDEYLLSDDTPDDFYMDMEMGKLPKLPVNLISNTGKGRARPEVIAAARRDTLAVPYGNFATVRDLATGAEVWNLDPFRNGDRSSAVAALGRFPTDESFTLLRTFLNDPDRSMAAAAMRGLAKMGLKFEPAENLYQQLLHGDDVSLRASATYALNERPITPEVIRFAKEVLSHDDLMVRTMAMSVLARQCKNDPEIKEYINSIYDDPDPKMQSIFETKLLPTCINREREKKGRFRE
ncbi:MAG: HEAT repeat domain-containing protein [Planctomycetes bacterium]|nr:HEAT repeat domain-containing protein [Planctomycetota bacterium]